MSALIATLCCIFTATGWVWESLRHLKQMEKAADLSQEMVAENIKLRRELSSEKFRSNIRIAELESEKSNLNKELTEAKNKLKTACEHINTLRWMVSDLEQGKPIIRGIAK